MFNPLRLFRKNQAHDIQQRAFDGMANGYPFALSNAQYQYASKPNTDGIATVYACDRVISNGVAINKLQIVKPSGSGREPLASHPLARLIDLQPNERDTQFEFIYRLVSQLNRYGNGVAYIERDDLYNPIALYPLNPCHTRAVNKPPNSNPPSINNPKVFHYETVIDGDTVRLSPFSVLHIKGADEDGFNGVSVLNKYRRLFTVADAQESFTEHLYRNGLSAGTVVSYPPEFEADDLEALRKDVDRYSGLSAAHKAMILNNLVKVESLGMNLDDAQFVESAKLTKAAIAGVFGAPLSLIDGSYQTYDKVAFVTGVLGAIGALIEQEFTLKLLREDEISSGLRFRFDWSESLRLSPEAQTSVLDTRIKSGLTTINEGRAALNLAPVTGGDVPLIEGEKIRLEDAGAKYASGIQQTPAAGAESKPPESTESLAERLAPIAADWISRSNTKALNAFKRLEKKHEGVDLRAAVADLEQTHREFVCESGEPIAKAYGIDVDKFYGMAARYVSELLEGFQTADNSEETELRAFADEQRELLIRKLTA